MPCKAVTVRPPGCIGGPQNDPSLNAILMVALLSALVVQKWMRFASTKTARHKLARFLKEHAPEELFEPSPSFAEEEAEEAAPICTEEARDLIFPDVQPHMVELTLGVNGRPDLADDIVAVIRQHSHQIEVGPVLMMFCSFLESCWQHCTLAAS